MTISNKNESEIPTSVLSVMNEKKPIYADFNGSAPLSKPVREYLVKRIEEGPFANPNAIHKLGKKVHMGMENARLVCAKSLGAKYNQVIFNSGATEGINAIFHNCLSDAKERKKPIFIMSGIEHAAIPNTGKYYEKKGLTCKILPTLENGIVDIEILEEWLKEFGNEVSLLTIMAANNDTPSRRSTVTSHVGSPIPVTLNSSRNWANSGHLIAIAKSSTRFRFTM